MARYSNVVDSKFLFDYFTICFYVGSSALVFASWQCPYIARVFTNGKLVSITNGSVWISKSKMLHIYLWGFITNLLVYVSMDYSYVIPLPRILVAAHTIRRAFEIAISIKRPYSKMNLLAYLYGLAFYTLLPLITYQGVTKHKNIVMIAFPIASFLQCVVHLTLGRKKGYDKNVGFFLRYMNHFAELVIFICIYLSSPSKVSLLMAFYVLMCMFKLIHLNYRWYPKRR